MSVKGSPRPHRSAVRCPRCGALCTLWDHERPQPECGCELTLTEEDQMHQAARDSYQLTRDLIQA